MLFKKNTNKTSQKVIKNITKAKVVKKPVKKAATINHYLNAQDQWRDRFAKISSQNTWLLLAFFTCLFVLVGSIGAFITISSQSKYEPYLVVTDSFGTPLNAGIAKPIEKVDQKIVLAQIANFIQKSRTVTVDAKLLRNNVFTAYSYININDTAKIKLDEWFNEQNPFERATKELAQVQIQSIISQTPDTYQVDWIETIRDRNGKKIADNKMRGLVTWYYGQQKTEIQDIILNPVGIYIKDFDWTKIN